MQKQTTQEGGTDHETTGLAAIEAARSDLEKLAERDDLRTSRYARALLQIADEAEDTGG